MLGLEMSDGARNVSLGGGAPYPPQHLLTQGNNTDFSNGCYVNSNNINNNNNDDVISGFSHHDNKDSLCDIVGNGMDTFHNEDHLQVLL
jgi:hypothetical protein